MQIWNPWHGCHKISEGCRHCYVYREDAAFGIPDASANIRRTASFDLPMRLDRKRRWKFPAGTEFGLCFTSDFLLNDADKWRSDIWRFIRIRKDCSFLFFTKRIERFKQCLPEDWENGYDNVAVGCTVENQDRANFRLPVFLKLPIKHRLIIAAPILENLDLSPYLDPKLIEAVSAGGESGKYARITDFNWINSLREQCLANHIPFTFHQTGSYLKKDGRIYHIPRPLQHTQAKKSGMDTSQ